MGSSGRRRENMDAAHDLEAVTNSRMSACSFGGFRAAGFLANQRDGLEEAFMWEDNSYCWVVICKNNSFHKRANRFFKHKIPLGETDVYSPPPALRGNFTVRCDECQKEYLYKPSDVLRHDQELPVSFTPHPLFRLNLMPSAVGWAGQNVIELAAGADRRRSERLFLDVGLIVRGISVERKVFGVCVERKVFQEPTFTISVSAHGALVVMSTKVAIGQTLFLKDPATQKEMEGRVTRFGPLHGNEAQVGINFTQPTLMFWPAVFPPKSWKSVATPPQAPSSKFAVLGGAVKSPD
jgi:hypothetical protein